MKIKKVIIKNFRLFDKEFIIDNINIPNDIDEGSGLTILVGENGCGKTSLLDAISLPLLKYKAESFEMKDFNNIKNDCSIDILCDENYKFKGVMPKTEYQGKGFEFKANIRKQQSETYLSSIIVQDQLFIKADEENKAKQFDLRINVNNPFSGLRFYENDILYLDRNRIYQTHSGVYNNTKFDKLMEDFNYQYIKPNDDENNINNIQDITNNIKKRIEQDFLGKAVKKFKEISDIKNFSLNLLNKNEPFTNAFFAEETNNGLLLPLSSLGSGYEMIFSLIYSVCLAEQSKKKLIILIDEPELHMHPALQLKFINFLIEISKTYQVIFTTHSPLLIKQVLHNEKVKIYILNKKQNDISITDMNKGVLPYISANEINYNAFNLLTEEYHNELYGYIQKEAINENSNNNKEKCFDNWLKEKYHIEIKKDWIKESPSKKTEEKCTLQTYIRNYIHHPENNHNKKYTKEEIKESIEKMISIIKNWNK